jgi:hypothetical protein
MSICAECGNELEQGSQFCGSCGAKVPPAEAGAGVGAGGSAAGALAGASGASPGALAGAAPGLASWACPHCASQNTQDALFCYACGSARPPGAGPAGVWGASAPPPAVRTPGPPLGVPAGGGAPPPPRSAWVRWLLLALFLCAIIAVGALVAVLVFDVGRSGGQEGSTVPDMTSPPTTDDSLSPSPSTEPSAGGVAVARDLTGACSLTASSNLPAAGNSYDPWNLVDGSMTTCWAEDAAGYGIGEVVTFSFDETMVLTRLRVIPGYAKQADGWDRWWSNGRLRRVKLSFSDGSTEWLDFADRKGWQEFDLGERRTDSVEMTIVQVYPAEPGPHSAEDTSVSEVELTGWSETDEIQ